MKYEGIFYDHQVAQARPVTIQLHAESLQLQLAAPPAKLLWLFSEVSTEVAGPAFIRIVFSGDPAGTLEVTDPEFIRSFLQLYRHPRSTGLHQLVLRGGLKTSLLILSAIMAILVAVHFLVLPWCVNRIVDVIPLSFDKELGTTARNSMNETPDTAASRLLTTFAAQMKWDTADTLTFTVVKSRVKNAYALPGGYIVVYSGLLEKLQTPEQLAALLCHEAAHVSHRHGVRSLCRNMSTTLLITLAFSNTSGATAALYANAGSLYTLTYSRNYEKDADITGLATLRKNQVGQQGMLQLMELLQNLDKGYHTPEFLSSHPITYNRIRYIREEMAAHPATVHTTDMQAAVFRQLQQQLAVHGL